MKKLSLTVIIPFYNESSFLERSLNRVLDVDIFDQIILSDDCSTDDSGEIAKKFAKKYEHITYICSENNNGKGSALINSKQVISTSHVVIHDADLEYYPEDIRNRVEKVKLSPKSLILGSTSIFIIVFFLYPTPLMLMAHKLALTVCL